MGIAPPVSGGKMHPTSLNWAHRVISMEFFPAYFCTCPSPDLAAHNLVNIFSRLHPSIGRSLGPCVQAIWYYNFCLDLLNSCVIFWVDYREVEVAIHPWAYSKTLVSSM